MYYEVDKKTKEILGYKIIDENENRDCRMLLR
jgi:hypothetical protein